MTRAEPGAGAPAGPAAEGSPRWLTFLSDYGLDDVFVGVCKAVVARIAPQARVIDVCHQVAPQDVSQGAVVFAAAAPYLPVGVHLVLVDPNHAIPTRGIVVATADGSLLVGPDNGVLSPGWAALGGAVSAHHIDEPRLWLDTPSLTFRGRDIFAPVAGHLLTDARPGDVGPEVDVADLAQLAAAEAVVDDDHVHAEVRNVDHFGNLTLNVCRTDLEAAGVALGDSVELRCGGRVMTVPFLTTYGGVPPGRLALSEDAFRTVTLAVNFGHAARTLRLGRGDPLVISRLPQQPPAATR